MSKKTTTCVPSHRVDLNDEEMALVKQALYFYRKEGKISLEINNELIELITTFET